MEAQAFEPQQFFCYTDRGFDSASHIRAAYHGPALVTPAMHHANYLMSRARVSNEWGFKGIREQSPFLHRKEVLKVRRGPVFRTVRTAVTVRNFKICMKGSQASLYFVCRPPTLQQYIVR
jgi:hypothetical protein